MRTLLLVTVAGCSSAATTITSPTGDAAPIEVVADAAAPPISLAQAPAPVVGSAPASSIAQLAVTADGRTAVTADELGLMRVWPALDGSREPVVVVASPPAALAIARDGDELAIADLDHAGSLEIVRTASTGATLSITRVAVDRPIAILRATTTAFLAVTDDQHLDVLDLRGHVAASITPEPGARIAGLAYRGGAALALIATADELRGRWLVLAPGAVSWGASTAKLRIDPTSAQLSPDHRRIVARYPRLDAVAVVDLATGRTFACPNCDTTPVGFIDAHTMALAGGFGIAWWSGGDTTSRGFDVPAEGDPPPMPKVAIDGKVVIGSGNTLVLHDPNATRYLGYQVIDFDQVVTAPGGWWMTGDVVEGGSDAWTRMYELIRVDDRFHERRHIELPDTKFLEPLLLDGRYALAVSRDRYPASDLYRIDLRHPTDVRVVVSDWRGSILRYEPTTHLLATIDNAGVVFARFDPKTGAIGPQITMPTPCHGTYEAVYPLDPRRSRGNVALVVCREPAFELVLIRAVCDTCATDPVRVGHRHSVDSVAAANHVLRDYGVRSEESPSVVDGIVPLTQRIYRGDLVAELDANRITLREGGRERWVVPAHGAKSLAWGSNGALVAIGSGLARLDLDTGDLVDRQCGWRFGLSDHEIHEVGSTALCDAR